MLTGLDLNRALVITKIPIEELRTVKNGIMELSSIEKDHIDYTSNNECKK